MSRPTDGGTRLHPTGAIPRPRHPSGRPTITPIKPRVAADDEVPRATRSLYGSSSGNAAGARVGEWISRASPRHSAARAAAESNVRSPKGDDNDTDEESDGGYNAPDDMNETWEMEAAEEMASDMWLDELEFRMSKVYERVGRQQQQWAEKIQQNKAGAGDGMGMTQAFEEDLVNDQKAWMQELEQEIARVYEGMGKVPSPQKRSGASTTNQPSPERASSGHREPKHSHVPPLKAARTPDAAAADEAPSGSVSNFVDGLESLRAVAEAEEERAREQAVARSRQEAEQKRSAVEEAEDEARAAAIARSRKEAEEQRLAARMAKNKAQAAQELRKNQAQRVHDLREQAKDEEKKAADKQKVVSDICDRLASKVKNKSFPAVLESFGIQINRQDDEGKRIPETEAMAKAYKKAMVKFHPDRAQQRGLGEAAQMEAEETYKLLQNLYENYRRKATPATGGSSSSSTGSSGSHSARSGPGRPGARQGRQGQRAGAAPGRAPRPQKPSGPYTGGDGGGAQQQRPGSAKAQRAKDNERYKPDWQKRAEAAAREHARPKEHRDDAKFTGASGGYRASDGAAAQAPPQDANGRQAKQDSLHARTRYRHNSADSDADGDSEARGAELRREVERRPRARRVAEQSLRELVRRQRLWFRNAREKQQLRDIMFAKAMKGKSWLGTDEQALQQFVGTLRSYS